MLTQPSPPSPTIWVWMGYGKIKTGPAPGDEQTGISILKPSEVPSGSGFLNGFPAFEDWAERLGTFVPFPAAMPDWAPVYDGDSVESSSPVTLDPLVAGGFAYPSGGSAQVLRHQRLWLRGPEAPAGGMVTKMVLVKERSVCDAGGTWATDEPEISEVTFTTPEGQRISYPVDLVPTLSHQQDPGYTNPPTEQAEAVTRRVSRYGTLLVDADMDGFVDLKKDEVITKDANGHNVPLKASEKGLILDINNNNTNAGGTGAGNTLHDHVSADVDGQEDEDELIFSHQPAAAGHLHGKMLIRLQKDLVAKELSLENISKKYKLYLRRTGDACVRVHHRLIDDVASDVFNRRVIGLGADRGTGDLPDDRTETWIPANAFALSAAENGYYNLHLIVEGVAHGVCEIEAEVRLTFADAANPNAPPLWRDKVKIQVNVDQTPDTNLNHAPGVALSGQAPHFVGVDYGNILAGQPSTASIVALRGRFRAEIPAWRYGNRWLPQLTAKHSMLRTGTQATQFPPPRSTASFWCGVRASEAVPSPLGGSAICWAQAGLLFVQRAEDTGPNQVQGGHSRVEYYLETGRDGFEGKPLQTTIADTGGSGGSVTRALQDWETRGILLDFILFTTPTASPHTRDPWFVVCRDARVAAGNPENYFMLEAPPPPGPDPGTDAINEALDFIHKNARYNLPQVKMELGNSAGFLFGTPTRTALVENLRYATIRTGPAEPALGGGDPAKSYFLWADGSAAGQAGFNWTAVPQRNLVNRPRIQFRTGLLVDDGISLSDAANDVHRYFWHCRLHGGAVNSIEFFDDRFWAFPQARRQ